MPIYSIRVLLIVVAFFGWLVYQSVYRKQKLRELHNDALAILFFAAVWGCIIYLFF